MENPQTCGQGLAQTSALPALLAELIASLAENLAVHMKALDLTDENAQKEYDAYQELAKEYHTIAAQLKSTAQKMAGYRDLPMGSHDQEAMSGPKPLRAFEQFVTLEQELGTLLRARLEQDQKMLGEMGGAMRSAAYAGYQTPGLQSE
jgi:hypothetical protein